MASLLKTLHYKTTLNSTLSTLNYFFPRFFDALSGLFTISKQS